MYSYTVLQCRKPNNANVIIPDKYITHTAYKFEKKVLNICLILSLYYNTCIFLETKYLLISIVVGYISGLSICLSFCPPFFLPFDYGKNLRPYIFFCINAAYI